MQSELAKRILSSIILLPLCFYLIIEGSILFLIFLIACFFISCMEWFNISKGILAKVLGIFFLIFAFYSFYAIRTYSDSDYFLLLFLLTISISTDIGGYVFGKIFRGPKLTKYSPNKTISGVFGSYLVSFLFFLVISKLISSHIFILKNLYLVFLFSTISQLGDIIISYFKRVSNIKDTGKVIPGHGGLLDRIDGMIFVFPSYYILSHLNIIN